MITSENLSEPLSTSSLPSHGLVAIVGRPNVGKSSLFNRLVGQRIAITEDQPGTTRDRIYGDVEWSGGALTIVDTGGLDFANQQDLAASIRWQIETAASEADLALLVVDGVEGLTIADTEAAQWLRKLGKPVIVVVNKVDNERRRQAVYDFYRLGFEHVCPVSALHGRGADDLLDLILELLPAKTEASPVAEDEITVAIVGRPNVGKSSLLNFIVGDERAVVSETPGTTRDTIDSPIEFMGRKLRLVDTAGIRRPGRIGFGVEKFSVGRALRAINRSDVVILLIDAGEGVIAQDIHLAGYADEEGKGLIVAANKCDLLTNDESRQSLDLRLRSELNFATYASIEFISAKTGYRVNDLMSAAIAIYDTRRLRIPTPELNQIVHRAYDLRRPASVKGRSLKLYYATQISVAPPTFAIYVNDPKLAHFTYIRYLINQIRRQFDFAGTPIRIALRERTRSEGKANRG